MKILHVTECYAGGVSRAINSLSEATKQHSHSIIKHGVDRPEPELFDRVEDLGKGHLRRFRAVYRAFRSFSPDLVIAHSSWAGFYARSTLPPRTVLYEPHCYVFDDPGRTWIARQTYRAAEKLFAPLSLGTLVLSEHEDRLAKELHRRGKRFALPNAPTLPVLESAERRKTMLSSGYLNVVMVGRLAPQKDPDFFASVAQLVHGSGIRLTWIGDGDAAYRHKLEGAGVEVTGWLDAAALQERLKAADIYFHSASYEGFPLSVLDAWAVGLPVFSRDIPCFAGTGVKTVQSEADAAQLLVGLQGNPRLLDDAYAARDEGMRRFNLPAQAAAFQRMLSELGFRTD
ncbi:glycosyltransferase family 4 protein [Zhihengliuella flava]|uniref:D-inositol 3-phosphate glycosyltransferase n=1 Tax=Zhihengliuella flava TaxID=1285193 RepID=A0A931D864_9MICC|nr:glycosyltransferase family 4 protein [Zhihengliuella flava]MBG6085435.1 glycosyltransferase involved in cell wall biosynthesis [Zhihengliuella flava]